MSFGGNLGVESGFPHVDFNMVPRSSTLQAGFIYTESMDLMDGGPQHIFEVFQHSYKATVGPYVKKPY